MRLPIPTQEDYQAVIDMFDDECPDDELHEAIKEVAHEFSSTMLVQLGTLARTVNPVIRKEPGLLEEGSLGRYYDHHDLCRAIAYGAATGMMVGQNIYGSMVTLEGDVWFKKDMLQATDDEGNVVTENVVIETDDIVDLFRANTSQIMEGTGRVIERWLQSHAERMLEDANDIRTIEWYLNAAAHTLLLFERIAKQYNQL